jgi:hypothetical protein
MRHIQRILFFIIILLFCSNQGFSQDKRSTKLIREIEKMDESFDKMAEFTRYQILKLNNGYLVCGTLSNRIEVYFYDSELNTIKETFYNSIREKQAVTKIANTEYGYRIDLLNGFLKLDFDGNKIELKEWTTETLFLTLEKVNNTGLEHYVPYSPGIIIGIENTIEVKDIMIEIMWKTQSLTVGVMGQKTQYNGSPIIRGFTKSLSGDGPDTYELIWEKELDITDVASVKWYKIDEETIYLSLSGPIAGKKKDEAKFCTQILKVNPRTGDIEFKKELKTQENLTFGPANLAFDKMGDIFAIGNYCESSSLKNGVANTMDGWYAIKLSSEGIELAARTFKFELHVPKKFSGKEFSNFKDESTCIALNYIAIDSAGHICIAGENIRRTFMRIQGGYERPQLEAGQVYGISYFELDINLELVKNNYFPQLYTDREFKQGKKYPAVFQSLFVMSCGISQKNLGYIPNCKVEDFQFNEAKKQILFQQDIAKETEWNAMTLVGENKGKTRIINTPNSNTGDVIINFLNNDGKVVTFTSSITSHNLQFN